MEETRPFAAANGALTWRRPRLSTILPDVRRLRWLRGDPVEGGSNPVGDASLRTGADSRSGVRSSKSPTSGRDAVAKRCQGLRMLKRLEREDRHGVLMRGIGRWLVYSRPRAWFGTAIEFPRLLGGVNIPCGAICLDIATGIGWGSLGLVRRDPSVRIVALDYDGTILPRTRAYFRAHGAVTNTALCRADAKQLPFGPGCFDLVLCLYGLHHFRGYLAALREIARVLKPGGTFALIDPIRDPSRPPGGHHGLEVTTSEELFRMLAGAGFEIVRSRVARGSVKVVTQKVSQHAKPADLRIAQDRPAPR